MYLVEIASQVKISYFKHWLITFTQNNDLNKSVWEILTSNHNDGEQQFFVQQTCWWLQLWPSNFNVSLDWLLNLYLVLTFWFWAYQKYHRPTNLKQIPMTFLFESWILNGLLMELSGVIKGEALCCLEFQRPK